MSAFEQHLNEKLGHLFGPAQGESTHRHKFTEVVGGQTMYDGIELARCRCGKTAQRGRTNRWSPISAERLTELTGGRA